MAPLGTDEEAAGTQLSPDDIASARAAETSTSATDRPRRRVRHAWVLAVFVLLLAGLFIGVAATRL